MNLSFVNDKDDERRRKSPPSPESQGSDAPKARKKRGGTPEVGHALRAAYQKTIDESIPPEFLDLLGKLG
ncbi:MAG TPA: NepR family anti-sigma factor [Allosphingosinicella sp.]